MLGPHFYYDLIRLARRSRTRDLRILYGLALLFGLGMIYWFQFPREKFGNLLFNPDRRMNINEGARFAEIFLFTVIVVQNLTVLLLTPVYVGSAIAEEKERTKPLDLLFATQMKDYEIILGKMFSRMTHLGAILLGGLPVLSLAQLWGGIDFPILVANFINTGLLLLSVGGISILVSTLCRKVVNTVMIIYGFVLPVTLCLGIFSMGGNTSILGLAQSDLGTDPEMILVVLGGLAAFHGMIAIACVSVALVVMRGQHGGDDFLLIPPPPRAVRATLRLEIVEEEERRPSFVIDRFYDLPPIHDDPLVWKEMNVGYNKHMIWPLFHTLLGLSLAMLLLVFLSMVVSVEHRPWFERTHSMAIVSTSLHPLGLVLLHRRRLLQRPAPVVRTPTGTLDALAYPARNPRRYYVRQVAWLLFPRLALVGLPGQRDRPGRFGHSHPSSGGLTAPDSGFRPRRILLQPGSLPVRDFQNGPGGARQNGHRPPFPAHRHLAFQ